jgi:hypothetical protein
MDLYGVSVGLVDQAQVQQHSGSYRIPKIAPIVAPVWTGCPRGALGVDCGWLKDTALAAGVIAGTNCKQYFFQGIHTHSGHRYAPRVLVHLRCSQRAQGDQTKYTEPGRDPAFVAQQQETRIKFGRHDHRLVVSSRAGRNVEGTRSSWLAIRPPGDDKTTEGSFIGNWQSTRALAVYDMPRSPSPPTCAHF